MESLRSCEHAPSSARADAPLRADVDAMEGHAFDTLMQEFDDASYEQTSLLLDGVWGPARTSHVVLRRAGQAVAGARVLVLTPPLLGRGVAYIKFGPFWRPRGVALDKAAYRAAMTQIVEEYAHRRGHCLTVLLRPSRHAMAQEASVLADMGFVQRRAYPDNGRYVVRVAPTQDEQFRDIDQKWRNKLRQALAQPVAYRVSQDAEAVATFQALHRQMEARKALSSPPSLQLLPQMVSALPPMMAPQVLLASHGGRPVAGAVFGVAGDTAQYLYAASSAAALPLSVGYGMQWRILDRLREQGVVHYDMGGTAGQQGLHHFKKGLLGRSGAIVSLPQEYEYCRDRRGRMGAELVFAARAAQQRLRAWKARLL